ncbi:MAG: 16S rRNA (uracil(1498)-N(3))-methyltransferase, partial [Nitrospirota bacterium]|nr:16S rRNA (uracil(1498)-N(3))-methyltransferase [Nitrospirota bacterium]
GDGRGTEYRSRIAELGKTEIKAEVLSSEQREVRGPRIVLGQGIAKSDKMDWIVQKATELGVSSIVPLVTERTIVKVKDEEKRVTRWQKICREAAMQSNRPDIPKVEAIASLGDFILSPATGYRQQGPGSLLLLPWEEAAEPIKNVLRSHADSEQVIVLIGPEGGFSKKEADLAIARGFHSVSLGTNILRTETAAIAVLGMIGYECS